MFHKLRKRTAMFLAGFFFMVALAPLRADDRCARRVEKAEARLHEAIEHHGEHSRIAEKRREELHRVREACHMHGDRDFDHDHH